MILGLLCAAVGFPSLPPLEPSRDDDASGREGATPAPAVLILTSIVIYVAAFALGLGNVPSMQSNFVMRLTFLPLMNALSPSCTFALYAGICTVGCYLVFRLYPEMAGLSLEEAAALLEGGWAVR
ncbi:hypothetical protein F5Y07DRAFT_402582 [Xylaria sp. FL0933]|nr:hypothetical protein F5Y07DRAFT_402582 [Xylaria sp. FL0933]